MEPTRDLLSWLQNGCGLTLNKITALPADAGARCYFRLDCANQSFIAMDAHLAKDSCRPYVAIARELRKMNICTPEILALDYNLGYLLITYLGDQTYLKALTVDNAEVLYSQACETLAILQNCRVIPGLTLAHFDSTWVWQEWAWHKEWFLNNLLGLTLVKSSEELLNQCYDQMVESALSQPQVFMHRDYHSANLMVLANGKTGVLDFQDAFIGPITYDVVSLLRDCYIDWPQDQVTAWALDYWDLARQKNALCSVSDTLFLRWFDWMGIERHLKALFTFARKYVRDQDSRYLAYIPRTLNYIIKVSERYPELNELFNYYHSIVQPAVTKKVALLCAR